MMRALNINPHLLVCHSLSFLIEMTGHNNHLLKFVGKFSRKEWLDRALLSFCSWINLTKCHPTSTKRIWDSSFRHCYVSFCWHACHLVLPFPLIPLIHTIKTKWIDIWRNCCIYTTYVYISSFQLEIYMHTVTIKYNTTFSGGMHYLYIWWVRILGFWKAYIYIYIYNMQIGLNFRTQAHILMPWS